jgi:hypothetical protein
LIDFSSAKKVKTLNMYKDGKAQHNAAGKVTKAASFQSREKPVARIEPNRKWFTNSRVISQDALNSFREAMAERANDPYSVLLKTNKLPMSLIRDGQGKNGLKEHQAKMTVEAAPFSDVFGPKAQRKRVKLGVGSLEDLAEDSVKSHDTYLDRLEQAEHPAMRRQLVKLLRLTMARLPVRERLSLAKVKVNVSGMSFTKSSIRRMWSYMFWMPEILWEHDVEVWRNTSRTKPPTNISFSYLTSAILYQQE